MLASHEALILAKNPLVRNINQLLHNLLPSRTIEAIKGQRKRVTRKELVQRISTGDEAGQLQAPHSPSMPILRPAVEDPIMPERVNPLVLERMGLRDLEEEPLPDAPVAPADEVVVEDVLELAYNCRSSLQLSISETVGSLGLDRKMSHGLLTSYIIDLFLAKTRRPTNTADPTPTNRKQRRARAQRL